MTDANKALQNDTVAEAEKTPDLQQPWADLGLKEDEYERIRGIAS